MINIGQNDRFMPNKKHAFGLVLNQSFISFCLDLVIFVFFLYYAHFKSNAHPWAVNIQIGLKKKKEECCDRAYVILSIFFLIFPSKMLAYLFLLLFFMGIRNHSFFISFFLYFYTIHLECSFLGCQNTIWIQKKRSKV